MRSHVMIRLAVLSVLLLAARVPAWAAPYHEVGRAVLGGDGGWDLLAVDAEGRRLYIARSDRVMVVDADRDSLIGELPGTPGVHGVAVAHDLGRGFCTDGADTSTTIFDLKDLKPVGKVRTGVRPDAVVYDPATRRVFTMNAGSDDATVIDAERGEVVGTIPLGGRPELAVVDGAGRLYVNLEDSSAVVAVDTRALKAVSRWSLAPGEEPTGLALDAEHHRLFSACANGLMVVTDPRDGRVVATVPIGKRVDGAAFDPGTGLAFSPNGEGSLTVIREETPDRFTVRETVPTMAGARTIALDARTHRVFLVSAQFGPAPAPTAEHPRPRRPVLPGTFVVLEYGESDHP